MCKFFYNFFSHEKVIIKYKSAWIETETITVKRDKYGRVYFKHMASPVLIDMDGTVLMAPETLIKVVPLNFEWERVDG